MKTRHCLPNRVRAMLAAMNRGAAEVEAMVRDACQCPSRDGCCLGKACESIHRSFQV